MIFSRYLVVGRRDKWAKPTAKLTTNSPRLESHEISMKLEFDIPDALFDRPQLQASITVPADAVSGPTIEADVVDNIQEEISKQLGVDLQISVIENADHE